MISRGRDMHTRLGLLGLIALALLAPSCARSRAAAQPTGPVPAGILLTPSAGEDFVQPILFLGPIWRTVSGPVFAREPWRFRPDFEMSRPDLMTADGDTVEVAHVMAVLDRAAREGDAKCPPVRGYPTWPATWNVRVFDRATPDSAHVAREFTVSARAVRCMAGAELAALKDDRDATWRSGMEQLATLGLPQTEPPMPRPLLAPAEQRTAILAALADENDAQALGTLDVSLWFWPASRGFGIRGARFADFGDRTMPKRPLDADVVALPRSALRALIVEALADSAVVRGAERARGALPMSVSHGEFRILDRAGDRGGPHYSQPLYLAFLTRDETVALADRLSRVLDHAAPGAAGELAVGRGLLGAR
jgi:hypothetical protein